MKDYLKEYAMVLHTVGPVHIGSGKTLNKKEYVLQKNQGKVWIPDVGKLYARITQKGFQGEFETYLLSKGKDVPDLGCWLGERGMLEREPADWVLYELDGGDFLQEKEAIQIMACQKDNYGLPYVPGSSIKGMLRTILLAYEIRHRENAFAGERRAVLSEADTYKSRIQYLRQNSVSLEIKAFYTLERKDHRGKEIQRENAINDWMSGLIVSDSAPLSLEDLVLCQKCDEDVSGNMQIINILREAIKPDREIRFTITIDEKLCPYTIEDIFTAVKEFNEMYDEVFLSHFSHVPRPDDCAVWMGGGTGFVTKTVLYPLLGRAQAVRTAVDIFEKTMSGKIAEEHKHDQDIRLGVSPHILKCTQYQGEKYQMGMCTLLQEK